MKKFSKKGVLLFACGDGVVCVCDAVDGLGIQLGPDRF